MGKYKLTYFNGKGRAESSRMLFVLAGVEYEDHRLKEGEWPEVKPGTPFGQVPVLEVEGIKLCQSHTIERFLARRFGFNGKNDIEQAQVDMLVDTIEDTMKPVLQFHQEKDEVKLTGLQEEMKKKYLGETLPTFLGQFEKILDKNGTGFFVGDTITLADIGFAAGFDFFLLFKLDYDLEKSNPKLHALKAKVESNEKIAAWIAKRPVTKF